MQQLIRSVFSIALTCSLVSACGESNANNAIATETVTNAKKVTAVSANPRLVINAEDVTRMQAAVKISGSFQTAYLAKKASVDAQMATKMIVPVPADGGGGYTHEQHKANYLFMLNAGTVYQITQDVSYANYVRDILLAYADMYPTLPLHPKRKVNAQNPGKLFWQSLRLMNQIVGQEGQAPGFSVVILHQMAFCPDDRGIAFTATNVKTAM